MRFELLYSCFLRSEHPHSFELLFFICCRSWISLQQNKSSLPTYQMHIFLGLCKSSFLCLHCGAHVGSPAILDFCKCFLGRVYFARWFNYIQFHLNCFLPFESAPPIIVFPIILQRHSTFLLFMETIAPSTTFMTLFVAVHLQVVIESKILKEIKISLVFVYAPKRLRSLNSHSSLNNLQCTFHGNHSSLNNLQCSFHATTAPLTTFMTYLLQCTFKLYPFWV